LGEKNTLSYKEYFGIPPMKKKTLFEDNELIRIDWKTLDEIKEDLFKEVKMKHGTR